MPLSKKKEGVELIISAYGSRKECIGIIEKVETPPSGGVFTKLKGCNYLYKGYPDPWVVDYIYASKRVIAGFFPLFLNKSVRFILGLVFLLYLILPRRLKKSVIISILDYFLGITHWVEYKNKYALSTTLYCTAIQEVYRTSEVLLKYITDKEIVERVVKLRDIFCMILQMDSAYRARFQDIVPEFHKDALTKNPKKEIRRVMDIFIRREAVDGMNAMTTKWQGLKKILLIILSFRRIKNILVKALLELDFDKVKMDEADFYFVCGSDDYNYRGLSYEQRQQVMREMDIKMKNKRPQVIVRQPYENN